MHKWDSLSKQEKSTLLKSVGLPAGLSQLSWSGLQKSERAKIEKVSMTKGEPKWEVKKPKPKPESIKGKGKGWHEDKEEVRTEKGIEKKAPIHREAALQKEAGTALNTPMEKKATHEEKKEGRKAEYRLSTDELRKLASDIQRFYKLPNVYIGGSQSPKSHHYPLKNSDIDLFSYFNTLEENENYAKSLGKDPMELLVFVPKAGLAGETSYNGKKVSLSISFCELKPEFVGGEDDQLLLNGIGCNPARKEKPTPSAVDKAVYDDILNKLRDAKTLKEVGEINQEATQAEISGKITFEQLQKLYSLVHEKDEYLIRQKESVIDVWKTIIKSATSKEEIGTVIKETNKSELLTADQKNQFETLAKKRLYHLFQEVQRADSDLSIVNEFKVKIEQATEIGQLQDLSIEITDNVASGKFAKAKVIPDDINILHELIDNKISRLYKERIGTTEEFSKKVPMNLIVISTEINRLRDLNKKIQASSLNQSRKDNLDILINSIIGGIRELSPKPKAESLDAISNIRESDAYKMLPIKISEFTTLTQLNTFSVEFNRQMKLMGIESVEDPQVSDIIKLMSAKRKQLAGTQETKIVRTPEKHEIDNLRYEAEHKPPELLPPKEIEDVTKYSWGLTEPEAVKKYVERERKKLQSNIDYVNKEKAVLDEMVTSKPHVLLTKAEIQKKYPPAEAEEKIRDLWVYKTKKSAYDKNVDSARFWQSKVDRIASGEWQTINTNYLREQYQKEVKEAIKHGKPVPYDVIKQYPEFTKAQDNRERYEKGRHTSFANVSIAVDTKHQENTGVKIKRQDGKALDEKTADDVIKALSQYQSVVGDITQIMKREDLTISHTGKKHPFLSTAAGIYHGTDVSISLGKGTGAHELLHFIDETAKRRHKDQPLYDYDLIALAKKKMNGGVYAIERAMSLSKYKSPEELEDARNLRYMLGSYWKRVEEVMARLVEQYTAYKNKGIQGTDLLHYPYELYIKTPAYWDDETFKSMLPQIEAELQRKIKLARE